jgi:septal ring factor EnvC (AmiA/AmiB activator)
LEQLNIAMFNPEFDPMAQLESLQSQVNQLTINQNQLVQALNHQAQVLKQINNQLAAQNNNILHLDTQQKILNAHVKWEEIKGQ